MCPRREVEESLRHFMFNCHDVKYIWIRILTRLKRSFKLRNDFVQSKTVLFGYHRAKPVVNLIVLLVKQSIIINKCRDSRSDISIDMIKRGIEHYFKTEKQMAVRSKTIDKFLSKWGGVFAADDSLDFNKIM